MYSRLEDGKLTLCKRAHRSTDNTMSLPSEFIWPYLSNRSGNASPDFILVMSLVTD